MTRMLSAHSGAWPWAEAKLRTPKPSSDTSRAPNFLMRMLQLLSNRMGRAPSAALVVGDVA